ncbi:hypothetical protein B0O99DRAFT_602278 [Bisporella sp. PMI_857]|nr:hypothetical protein B0O99DRAFT_602278 [Bisporella sp. PMI_857]
MAEQNTTRQDKPDISRHSSSESSKIQRPCLEAMLTRRSTLGSMWGDVSLDKQAWEAVQKAWRSGGREFVDDELEDARLEECDFELEDLDEDDWLDELGCSRRGSRQPKEINRQEVEQVLERMIGGKEEEKPRISRQRELMEQRSNILTDKDM